MGSKTKRYTLQDMAAICAVRGKLVGYAELEAMYNAVVHRRRWYRRLALLVGIELR